MNSKLFGSILTAAAVCAATPISLAAQSSFATYGSVEVAGFGEGSALIGTSWNTGRQGLGPVASIQAQTYRYRLLGSHAQAYAVSPSLGLVNIMPTGSVQASVGYSFVETDFPDVIGIETGSKSGMFASTMANYWGTGANTAQAIASYGFASEYYWTRLRAARRLAPSASPIYLGGEVVFQGSGRTSTSRIQVGPTIEYRFTPEFRMGMSGGYKGGNNRYPGTGYGRVEFLVLTKL